MELINNKLDKLNILCKKYHVSFLYAFGSVLRKQDFNEKSDIDFIVNFEAIPLLDYADNYFGLKFSLEDLFDRKIDLLEDIAIKNPYFRKDIDSSKKLIYG